MITRLTSAGEPYIRRLIGRAVTVLCVGLTLVVSPPPGRAEDGGPFQVVFGTRHERSGEDRAEIIVETETGDLLVAGVGGSVFTDIGERVKPLLARVDRRGEVLWSRTYDSLEGHRVIAMLERDDRIYMLVESPSGDAGEQRQDSRRVDMLMMDAGGKPRRKRLVLDPVEVHAGVAVGRNGAFYLAARHRLARRGPVDDADAPLEIYRVGLDGRARAFRLSEERKGVTRRMRVAPDGTLVALIGPDRRDSPGEIVWAAGDGRIMRTLSLEETSVGIARIEPDGAGVWLLGGCGLAPTAEAPVIQKLDDEGRLITQRELDVGGGISDLAATGDGGVLMVGVRDGAATATRLDGDGEPAWSRRFLAAGGDAFARSVLRLADGRFALGGDTGPPAFSFRNADRDAFLMVVDPAGEAIAPYERCTSDITQIRALRAWLKQNAGIVTRAVVPRKARPRTGDDPPELPGRAGPVVHCGEPSEAQMLEFLRAAVDAGRQRRPVAPPPTTQVFLSVLPAGAVGGGVGPSPSDRGGRDAQIVAEHTRGAEAMDYLAEQVLPYAIRMDAAATTLKSEFGALVTRVGADRDDRIPLIYAERVSLIEAVIERLLSLSTADRAMVRKMVGGLSAAGEPDHLHLWGRSTLVVGARRVDDVATFLLRTLPTLRGEITQREQRLAQDLSLEVRKSDAYMAHVDYRQVLDALLDHSGRLSDAVRGRIAEIGAVVEVSGELEERLHLEGYERQVAMRADATADLFPFLLEHRETLIAETPAPVH